MDSDLLGSNWLWRWIPSGGDRPHPEWHRATDGCHVLLAGQDILWDPIALQHILPRDNSFQKLCGDERWICTCYWVYRYATAWFIFTPTVYTQGEWRCSDVTLKVVVTVCVMWHPNKYACFLDENILKPEGDFTGRRVGYVRSWEPMLKLFVQFLPQLPALHRVRHTAAACCHGRHPCSPRTTASTIRQGEVVSACARPMIFSAPSLV